MTTRSLKNWLLTASGATLCALMPVTANAMDIPSFSPAAAWQTESSEAVGGEGQNCAVSAQFDNGFIVNMGGIDGKTEIVGVNFRQDVFNAGQNYLVQIGVPGVLDSPAAGTAIDGSTLGIGIAAQNAFFDGIKAARVLDLSIEGNDFRFQLKNFGDAVAFLEDCQDEATPPPVVMQMVQAPNSEPEVVTEHKVEAVAETQTEPEATNEARREPTSLVRPPAARTAQSSLETVTSSPATLAADARPEPRKRFIDQLDASMRGETMDMPTEQDLVKPPHMAADDVEVEVEETIETAAAPVAETVEETAPENVEKPVEKPRHIISNKPELLTPMPGEEEEMDVAAVSPVSAETMRAPTQMPQTIGPVLDDEPQKRPAPRAERSIVLDNADNQNRLVMTQEPDSIEERPIAPGSRLTKTVETRSMEADFTDLSPPAVPPAPVVTASSLASDDLGVRTRMRELEERLAKLENENAALESELEFALESAQEERASISNSNWDLERSTMLYHEAENQIKRLGMQLQKERARHEQEVRELEMMLFDPAVTSQQQLATLAKLEADLAAKEASAAEERRIYEERIRILESQLGQ